MTHNEYPSVITEHHNLVDVGASACVEFVPVLVEHHNRYERVLWAWQLRGSFGEVLVSSGHDGALCDAIQRFNAFAKRRVSVGDGEHEDMLNYHDTIVIVAAIAGGTPPDDPRAHGPYIWVQTNSRKTPIAAYSRTYNTVDEACIAGTAMYRGKATVLNLAGDGT